MPEVTIGIPVYNSSKYLNDAILSVFNQSYQDWELIIIDDGSTDDSLQIAKRYAHDKRVSIISDNKNRGLSIRLNQIANLAKGKYLARMDSDDIMHPERIKKQLNYLQSNPSVEIVCSYAFSINEKNEVYGLREHSIPNSDVQLFMTNLIIHPSVMMTREWASNNKYNPAFDRAEDYELWLRNYIIHRIKIIKEPLLFYRENGVFSLSKYYKTLVVLNKIYARYAFKRIGLLNTLSLYIRNIVKLIVYAILVVFNNPNLLVNKRGTTITEEQREYATELLKSAISREALG